MKKNMLNYLLLGILMMMILPASSQQNSNVLFNDAKGASSILLRNTAMVNVNFSDASVNLGFIKENTKDKFFWGLGVSGKTTEGLRKLFADGRFSPGADFSLNLGLKELYSSSEKHDGWIILKGNFQANKYKLFDPAAEMSKQISTKYFNSLGGTLTYNHTYLPWGNNIFGISIGFRTNNNYQDLDEFNITDRTIVVDSTIGGMHYSRSLESSQTLRSGKYETFAEIPLNVDCAWSPKGLNRIAFYHYYHAAFSTKFKHRAGTGIYLLEKEAAMKPLVGFNVEFSDLDKVRSGFGKSVTLNIVVGKTIGL